MINTNNSNNNNNNNNNEFRTGEYIYQVYKRMNSDVSEPGQSRATQLKV